MVLVNGSEVKMNYWRGMNVVVFDECTGATLFSQNFDTYCDSYNSDIFAKFIESLPIGRIVAVAVLDDAIYHLTERARIACESIAVLSFENLDIGTLGL